MKDIIDGETPADSPEIGCVFEYTISATSLPNVFPGLDMQGNPSCCVEGDSRFITGGGDVNNWTRSATNGGFSVRSGGRMYRRVNNDKTKFVVRGISYEDGSTTNRKRQYMQVYLSGQCLYDVSVPINNVPETIQCGAFVPLSHKKPGNSLNNTKIRRERRTKDFLEADAANAVGDNVRATPESLIALAVGFGEEKPTTDNIIELTTLSPEFDPCASNPDAVNCDPHWFPLTIN